MSLQIWLPLNGSLVNNGLSDLKFSLINTTNTTISTDSKFGKSYNNNSYSAGGITSDKSINLGQNQSMFCWFKFTTLNNNFSLGGGLVTQHNHSTNSGMGITIKYVSSTTGYISVNTGTGSARTYNTYCGTTLLQANTWYHGGYTYDGNNIKLYVNGVCENTISFTNMSVPANPIKVFIWSLSHQDYYFNGKLNDVRIYNHCLSLKEVKEISKGLVLHYPMNNNGLGFINSNIIPNTSSEERTYEYPTGSGYADRFTATTTIIPSASKYTLSFLAKSTVNGDKIRAYYYNPNTVTSAISSQGMTNSYRDGPMDFTLTTDWKLYWVTYTQSETTAVKHIILPRLFGPDNSSAAKGSGIISIKNVKLEQGDKPTLWIPNENSNLYNLLSFNNIISDCSGYENNAIGNFNLTYNEDSPKYNGSLYFNGSAQYLTLSNTLGTSFFNNDFTYSVWLKPTDTTRGIILSEYAAANASNVSFELTENLKVRFWWNSSPDFKPAESKLTQNVWNHVAIVKSTNQIKIYVNGVLKSTYSGTLAERTVSAVSRIGDDYRGGTAVSYQGYMSDFRIYATALTAQDIKELYNTPISVDNQGNCYVKELVEEYE